MTHAPVEFEYDDLALGEPDIAGLREKFSKLNFNKFLEELDGGGPETASKEFKFKTSKDLKDLTNSSKKTKEIFFKSVYDGENYIHSEIYKLAIKSKDTDVYIIEPEKIKDLKEVFEDESINKVSFDIKEEMVLLDKLGIDLIGPYDDIMLMHYLIDPSRSSYDLKLLSQSYLTYELDSDETLIGKGAKIKKYADVNQDDLSLLLASKVNAIEDAKDKVFKT